MSDGYERFLNLVQQQAHRSREDAERAARATLQTLAERIAGGEVRDLITQLPAELHEPLKRGDAQSHGAATRMPVEEFVQHVAEREGVTPRQALSHARAVFATLREAVSEQEFLDVTAQLPRDFAAVEARP
jgi:uncharacterized protein (DUF2267 family)